MTEVNEHHKTTTRTAESPLFTFAMPTKGIKAQAKEIEGQFMVLAGSSVRGRWEGAAGGYESLYEQLCASETLIKTESGQRTFAVDTVFSSPSAAAAVVAGRSANGRTAWIVDGRALTYGVSCSVVHVSKLIAQLAMHGQKRVNKIYDPACGSGSLVKKLTIRPTT